MLVLLDGWMVVRFVGVTPLVRPCVLCVSRVCPGSPRCLFTGTFREEADDCVHRVRSLTASNAAAVFATYMSKRKGGGGGGTGGGYGFGGGSGVEGWGGWGGGGEGWRGGGGGLCESPSQAEREHLEREAQRAYDTIKADRTPSAWEPPPLANFFKTPLVMKAEARLPLPLLLFANKFDAYKE